VLVLLVSCAARDTAGVFEHTLAESSGDEYVIGAPDVVRVTVWKHPELSVEMQVRRDGKISVPLLDDVQAAGLTPAQLKGHITEGLSASISRPNVTVSVITPSSQTVTVLGGVNQSGTIALHRDMGVVEAVAAAGGFTAWADKDDIRVVRLVEGRRVSYSFSYRAYLSGDPEADIFLKPGDVVVVPE
jgi:polysaccharide export outer membrane protein